MAPALRAALESGGDAGGVRQVVFLTDGAVGNEDELFSLIGKRIGNSRLFTIGIGSAPNSHFMRRAAQFGRGGFTYIGRVEEVGEKMEALFEKLESPMLSDLRVAWPSEAGTVDAYPRRLPDLYRGEPVLVAARMDTAVGDVDMTGTIGKVPWQMTAGLNQGRSRPGIGVLWARQKIAALMDSRHRGAETKDIRRQVIDVALSHHLVSKYTSLVAVDATPTRPESVELTKSAVPTNLPQGWKYEKVFGRLPQTATPAGLHLLIGLIALGAGFLGRIRQGKKA
jgi:Ca-activated chloride channel family protein